MYALINVDKKVNAKFTTLFFKSEHNKDISTECGTEISVVFPSKFSHSVFTTHDNNTFLSVLSVKKYPMYSGNSNASYENDS